MNLGDWEQWLDKYTGTRSEQGHLELLVDGEKFFPRIQSAFESATNHIRFCVYIFDRDDVAVSVADQLRKKSADVEVSVIMDRMGSIAGGLAPPSTPMPENFEPPSSIGPYLRKDSQVKVRYSLNPWLSADHSKVFLVDDSRAWLGGMNIGREYRYEWHDLMLEVTGPVISSLEYDFRRDWAHAGPFGDFGYAAALMSQPKEIKKTEEPGNWIPVRRLPTRTGWKPFKNAILASLERAKSYVYVENPYLFDKHVIADLVRARNRGVDVRVVMPRKNDLKVGGRSNLVVANYLLQHGVRVYFYPGMTHVKALLADGWTCIGSGNLNHLSLRICQEQNIATSDPAFAAEVRRDLFEQDFARSYELKEPLSVGWADFASDFLLQNF